MILVYLGIYLKKLLLGCIKLVSDFFKEGSVMRCKGHVSLILLCFLTGGVFVLSLSAETTMGNAITSLPYTISSQGVYYLTGTHKWNLATGAAITIAANDVILDLNGYKIQTTNGKANTAWGIYAYQRKNLTIKNGTIKGFYCGVYLKDSSSFSVNSRAHVVEDIRAEKNSGRGIVVNGTGCIIRNCQVVQTGGSTATGTPDPPWPQAVYGIYVSGNGNTVYNNEVADTSGTSSSTGIAVIESQGSVVEFNRLTNPSRPTSGYGIYLGWVSNILVVNNRLITWAYGVYYDDDVDVGATGKYRDNLTANCTTPFHAGTDAGNNN
jgi:hypothetical protein